MWEMDYETAARYWTDKEKDSVSMDPDDLKKRIVDFIGGHNTCALATASSDMVRCTPIEYNYLIGVFYLFSEGGLKFKGLKNNKRVGLAIYEPYGGFGNLKSLQVEGQAEIIEPFTDEYMKLLEYKKIPVDVIKKMPRPMNLIKITPYRFDYLDSDLKKEGFDIRQHLQESIT